MAPHPHVHRARRARVCCVCVCPPIHRAIEHRASSRAVEGVHANGGKGRTPYFCSVEGGVGWVLGGASVERRREGEKEGRKKEKGTQKESKQARKEANAPFRR